MTNKEILQANALDILFEHRNKDYGAYALRRQYNHRMLVALGLAMSLILLFVLMTAFSKKEETPTDKFNEENKVVIRTITLPHDKPKEPERPKAKTKAAPAAQIKNVTIKIVPDPEAQDPIPTEDDKKDKVTGTKNIIGQPKTGVVIPKDTVTVSGATTSAEPARPSIEIIERDPEFPGGPQALVKFLISNLNTPEGQSGEKKMVQIRFKIEKDGSVSSFEIVRSGGEEFDREVIRVCKKMPRWKPAFQNGTNVPVTYMLPVTFITTD